MTHEEVDALGTRWQITRDGSNRFPWRITDGQETHYARNLSDARRTIGMVVYGRRARRSAPVKELSDG